MGDKRRYGQWAGNEEGAPEDTANCVATVFSGWYSHQCKRKRGHGPDGLYCKQHAKKEEARLSRTQQTKE